jgi:hypothetical protein
MGWPNKDIQCSELDDFRTALAILHGFAIESPTLNQRGIVRMLERLINVAAQLSAEAGDQADEGRAQ